MIMSAENKPRPRIKNRHLPPCLKAFLIHATGWGAHYELAGYSQAVKQGGK